MPFFRRADYQSDTTQFIQKLKTARPELEAEQRDGRALLWDQKLDRESLKEFSEARIPQKPYVYQNGS
jgi:hypothetical protein